MLFRSDALAAARQQLGEHIPLIVPVCAAEGKTFGIAEELLPLMVERLDEARGVGMLRCLMAEANTGTARVVLRQLVAVGKRLVPVALEVLAARALSAKPEAAGKARGA